MSWAPGSDWTWFVMRTEPEWSSMGREKTSTYIHELTRDVEFLSQLIVEKQGQLPEDAPLLFSTDLGKP